MRPLAILPMLLLTACGMTYYNHPTKPVSAFNADKYDCQKDAQQAAYHMGLAGNPFYINSQIKDCLENKHGWVPGAPPPEKSPALEEAEALQRRYQKGE